MERYGNGLIALLIVSLVLGARLPALAQDAGEDDLFSVGDDCTSINQANSSGEIEKVETTPDEKYQSGELKKTTTTTHHKDGTEITQTNEYNDDKKYNPKAVDVVVKKKNGTIIRCHEDYANGKVVSRWLERRRPNGSKERVEWRYFPAGTVRRNHYHWDPKANGGIGGWVQDDTKLFEPPKPEKRDDARKKDAGEKEGGSGGGGRQ